jgi:hypothetical protein
MLSRWHALYHGQELQHERWSSYDFFISSYDNCLGVPGKRYGFCRKALFYAKETHGKYYLLSLKTLMINLALQTVLCVRKKTTL